MLALNMTILTGRLPVDRFKIYHESRTRHPCPSGHLRQPPPIRQLLMDPIDKRSQTVIVDGGSPTLRHCQRLEKLSGPED